MIEYVKQVAPKAVHIKVWLSASVVSILILIAVLWWSTAADVAATLLSVDISWLLKIGLFGMATSIFRFFRLWSLMPLPNRSIYLYGVISGHSFLNQILPFRTGEFVFPFLLRRATGRPYTTGLVDLLVIRIIELIVLLILVTTSFLIWWFSQDSLQADYLLVCVISVTILTCLSLTLWLIKPCIRFSLKLTERDLGLQRFHSVLSNGLIAVHDMRLSTVTGLVLTTLGMWMSLFGMYYSALMAMSVDVLFIESIFGSMGAVIANLIPINGIGSIGTMEIGWVTGFVALGKEPSSVTAAGIILHLSIIVISAFTALSAIPQTNRSNPDSVKQTTHLGKP